MFQDHVSSIYMTAFILALYV